MRLFPAILPLLLAPLVALPGCERDTTTDGAEDVTRPADAPAATDQPDSQDRAAGDPLEPTNRSRTAAPRETPTTPGAGGEDLNAAAEIQPTEGNDARGSIRLSSGNGTVRMSGTITGLEPGEHGFHIHESGDCSAPDGSSAGEHFNPHDDPHGSPQAPENAHHVGDFGNVTANEDGEAQIDIEDPEMKLSGAESVIGKALIVHADRDDLETQPSGNSGARLGCGEIREAGAQAPVTSGG